MRTIRPWTTLLVALLSASTAIPASASTNPRAPQGGPSVLTAPLQHAYLAEAVIGYRSAGTGPPLVLIPGSSQTMAEWDPLLLDVLARTRTVIVFDSRATGTSTGPVAGLTISTLARDTAQLIEQVTTGGRADVLGWSMGSYVAQELAINAPTRVRRLVLASADCGGPTTEPPTKSALKILVNPRATQMQRMSILFPPGQAAAAKQWQAAIGAAFAANDYQPDTAFTVPARTVAAQTRAAGSQWLGAGKGTCSRLPRITQPTLIGAGAQDVVVPAANGRTLNAGLPHSTMRTYAQGGHAFLFQPELGFTNAIVDFLH